MNKLVLSSVGEVVIGYTLTFAAGFVTCMLAFGL